MAKLNKGILGPISGRLGSIVGATWKNISYLRERPKKKKKKQPRTPAQLNNEMKFKYIQQWLVPFYPYINVGFANMAKNKTEINAAFSVNYKQAFSGTWPDIEIDYSKIKISAGNLEGLYLSEIELTAADTVTLSWQNILHPDSSFNDQLMLVLYCPELEITDGFVGTALRRDLHCSFKFNPKMIGLALEVYVAVTSLDRKKNCQQYLYGEA